MEKIKYIYYGNDINITNYEIDDNKVTIEFINKEKKNIGIIKIVIIDKEYEVEINSNEEDFVASFEIDDSHFISIPRIVSYVSDGETKKFNKDNKLFIKEPRVLNDITRKNKKRLKQFVIDKNVKLENDEMYYPFINEEYWSCYCGEINFLNKCKKCGATKRDANEFSNEIEEAKKVKRNYDSTEANFLTWQLILLFFHVIFINIFFNGDILYKNQDLVSFFSVFNRFIVPVLIIGTSTLLSFIKHKMTKLLINITKGIRLILLMYLNILMFISFANVSYNFFLTTGFDLIFLTFGIKTIINKNERIRYSLFSAFFAVSIIFSLTSVIMLNAYSFRVGKNDIYIEPVSCEIYDTPETLNNLPVTKIEFRSDYQYKEMKKIYISKNVKSISIVSPEITPNLDKIILDDRNENFYLEDGVLYYKDTNKVALIPSNQESVSISIKNITQYAFSNWKKLKKVVIKNSVVNIGDYAFEGCNKLSNITFEDNSSLERIGEYAFSLCISLHDIVVPNNVKEIGFGSFASCYSLKNMTLPFIGKKRYVNYDTANKNIFDYIFAYDYDNIMIDNLIVTNQAIVQNSSFYKCPVKNLVLNNYDGVIGDNCFAYSSLESIVIPEGVTEIGRNAFKGATSLKEISLPSTLKTVKEDAFKDVASLEKITATNLDLTKLVIEAGNDNFINILNNN